MSELVAHIDNVQKVYQKNPEAPPVFALRGVNIKIPRGQYVAIMGPSGSGKSTLMNVIGCLDRPTSGRYLLDGQDVATMSDEQISRVRGKRLGFVFQSFHLIPQLSVMENVQVPLFYQGVSRHVRAERAKRAIERVGLDSRSDHRPAELSGGQQQRVAIARALVAEPSILLGDEPTGNLDSTTGKQVLALFDELHEQGLTIILVTHDESVADRCERVIRLKDGLVDRDEMNAHAAAPST